jgi:hypothetical protein
MTEQRIEATAFGRVLREFMEARDLEATPEEIAALGERSGLSGKELLRDTTEVSGRRRRQNLTALADELGLTEPEKARLAVAYVFEDEIR